jgi:hypothetical protein
MAGKPNIFGLPDSSQDSLEIAGYELIGDPSDFHFYQKEYITNFRGRCVYIILKRYFISKDEVGDGVEIGPGVRLITLLKHYKKINHLTHISTASIKFYFLKDKTEGAIIFNDLIVVRFTQKNYRSGYTIVTLESDLDATGKLKNIATSQIKRSMDNWNFQASSRSTSKFISKSAAFNRLVKYLSRKNVSDSRKFD